MVSVVTHRPYAGFLFARVSADVDASPISPPQGCLPQVRAQVDRAAASTALSRRVVSVNTQMPPPSSHQAGRRLSSHRNGAAGGARRQAVRNDQSGRRRRAERVVSRCRQWRRAEAPLPESRFCEPLNYRAPSSSPFRRRGTGSPQAIPGCSGVRAPSSPADTSARTRGRSPSVRTRDPRRGSIQIEPDPPRPPVPAPPPAARSLDYASRCLTCGAGCWCAAVGRGARPTVGVREHASYRAGSRSSCGWRRRARRLGF
jgi:hypothetical protein